MGQECLLEVEAGEPRSTKYLDTMRWQHALRGQPAA